MLKQAVIRQHSFPDGDQVLANHEHLNVGLRM